MTFSYLRRIQCATLALALSSAQTLFAQSSALSKLDLPDSPSFSSSQQPTSQTPAQTQTPQKDQTSTPPPQNETEEQRKLREQREEAEREVKTEEKQRLGGVMPQFNVVMNGQGVALTAKQKWDLSFHTIIDPYTIGLAAVIGGGYGELTDDHTGYGHGPAGYFKRTAASYADNVIGNVVGNAMLPILLKQDPRYFRKGTGSVKSRIFYSAMTTFICHSDKGKLQFNTSNVLGNFIAGGISNAYYPEDERGFGLTMSNASVVTLEGMLGAQILEFSPDFTAYVHRRREHHRQVLAAQAAAAAAAKNPPPAPNVVYPTAPPPPPPQD